MGDCRDTENESLYNLEMLLLLSLSPPIGHMRSQLTNHQTILDVQTWSKE